MLSLQQDISVALERFSGERIDTLSHLARALWIATRATKLEHDAKIIIEKLVPEFFDGQAREKAAAGSKP